MFRFFSVIFFCIFIHTAFVYALEETPLEIYLKDPSFSQGVMHTNQGGIIKTENMRIQAKNISYTHKVELGKAVQKIEADEDLLIEYGERAFVGSRLEYDFLQKKGTLWNGKTFVDLWFLGGERVDLLPDGTYLIYGASVTTCENQDSAWEIHAKQVSVTQQHLLAAKNIQFRFAKLPLLWLPSFKSNLKIFRDPPVRYKVMWDKGLGPRVSMRYRVYSWEHLNLFLRLDYRVKRGLGGAIESDYHSLDKRTYCMTKSYGAHDKTVPDERGPKRYRLQGLYHTESKDQRTTVHLTYDKFSDQKMVSDFKSEDFEVNTQKRTLLLMDHRGERFFTTFSFQPRINRFQSLNQELPLLTWGIHPFTLGASGIISQNYFSTGYLDYVFAKDLHNFLTNTQSVRLETRNELYRPFSWKAVTVTPSLGLTALFYSKSPEKHPATQGIFSYGCRAQSELQKKYSHYKHLITPYLDFRGYTRPTIPIDHHYIFDIEDGYAHLNLLKAGVRQSWFSTPLGPFLPAFFCDLFTYGFFGTPNALHRAVPKAYASFGWNRPFLSLSGDLCYNLAKNLWDAANAHLLWTINAHIALSVELRHRSAFAWRKADPWNFFVDVARPLNELLDSPMSDKRNTLLTKLYMRLSPTITCSLGSHNGWGRKSEHPYNEARVDLYKLITSSWQMRLSYRYTPNDPFHVTGSLSIIK